MPRPAGDVEVEVDRGAPGCLFDEEVAMAAHRSFTSAGGWRRAAEVAAVVIAAVLQLVVGWFTSTSGLMAPLWAVALLAAVWVGAIVVLVRLARHRPLLTPLVPLANAVIWFAVMSAGGAWLGWTP